MGMVPVVENGCYNFQCILVEECADVTSCDACDLATQQCVIYDTQLGREYHCVPIPDACAGNPSCDCLGPGVCVGAYDTCNDTALGVACSCPAC